MSSFHIVCKKRKGLSMRNLKVLILSVPQKIRVGKERRMNLLRVQIKRNLRKVKTFSFVRNLDTKKECTKYHARHAKKGIIFTLVCSEINLASIPRNTWWLDSSATTHISVSMQGCLNYRRPSDSERYIFVGDGKSV